MSQAVLPLLPTIPSLIAIISWCLVTLIPAAFVIWKPRHLRLVLKFCWRQKIGLLAWAVIGIAIFNWATRDQLAIRMLKMRPPVNWTQYRNDPSRSGVLAEEQEPPNDNVLWVGGQGYTFYASPTSDGERVYASGFQKGVGRVFCWDIESGDLLWSVKPPGYRASSSSPVLVDDILVIGEGLHDTIDGRILGLDLRPGHEGQTVWEVLTKSHVESTAAVLNGIAYIGAGDDGVYAIDIRRESSNDNRVVWHLDNSQLKDVEASPLVVANVQTAKASRAYLFGGEGRAGDSLWQVDLDAIDPSNQRISHALKKLPTPFPVFSPPAYSEGLVVFGMGQGDYRDSGAGGGEIWCVNGFSMQVVWKKELGSTVLDSVAIRNQQVFAATGDGRLHCLDLLSGNTINEAALGSAFVTAPTITTNLVYVLSESGLLTCLESKTFEQKWQLRLIDAGRCFASPIASKDRLLIGTSNGFYAFGQKKVAQ